MYNKEKYFKSLAHIVLVYYEYNKQGLSDSKIVKNYFPKHYIFISYRQWMNIKGTNIKQKYFDEVRALLQENKQEYYYNKS